MSNKMNDTIPLTDPRLAAAATLLGGHLREVTQDPSSGRVTFYFEGLSDNFLQDTFNGKLTVNLRDYIDALERVQALIAQYRARRRQ